MVSARHVVLVGCSDSLGRLSSEAVLAVGRQYVWQRLARQETLGPDGQIEGENHGRQLPEQSAWYGHYLSELAVWKGEP